MTRLQQSSTRLYQTTHRKLKPAVAVAALIAGSVFGSTAQAEIVQLDLSGDTFSGYLFIDTSTLQTNPSYTGLTYYYGYSYISTPLASDGSSAYTTNPINPYTNTPVVNNAAFPYLIGGVFLESLYDHGAYSYFIEATNFNGSSAILTIDAILQPTNTDPLLNGSFPGAPISFDLYSSYSFPPIFSATGTISLPALTPPPVSAVPEPASWAMLLLGVGMVGGAVRYRRRQSGNATSQYRFA